VRQQQLAAARQAEAERQAQLNPGTAIAPLNTYAGLPQPAAAEPEWQRALRLRSEALNRQYGL
jgi:hypothetical protein